MNRPNILILCSVWLVASGALVAQAPAVPGASEPTTPTAALVKQGNN